MSTTHCAYCENKREWGNGDLSFTETQGILSFDQQCSGQMENTIYSKHLIVPDDSKRQKKKKVVL